MKILLKLIILFSFIPVNLLCSNDFIHSPFQNNYHSLLDYNRFRTFHQFSFFSFSGNKNSGSYGSFLSTIQYSINNSLTANLHLGKKMNFSNNDGFKLDSTKDLLAGGSLIYKTKSDLTLGIGYGTAPLDFNFTPSSFHINSLSPFSYLYDYNYCNNNLNIWLNKDFKKSSLSIYIRYSQTKPLNIKGKEY